MFVRLACHFVDFDVALAVLPTPNNTFGTN